MKGEMHIIRATGQTHRIDIDHTPDLKALQEAVDGYIEQVPMFDTYQGARAIAFCNEEGKIHDLPFNAAATALWNDQNDGRTTDALVGDIVVLTGDDAFMEDL